MAQAPAGSWAASTRIIFEQDNPKRSGSAAHERYEKYKVARTIAEAIELGAWKGDFNNDQKQGYLKKSRCPALGKIGSAAVARGGAIKRKASASDSEPIRKKPAIKPAHEKKVKESKDSSEEIGERKDIPLPSGSGCETLWSDMQKEGWRYCEFKYLAGIRKGMAYKRFVKPSGGSINSGIDEAIALYARQNNLDLKKLLISSGRQRVLDEEWNKRKLTPIEREKSVKAYRKKHGRVWAIPEGWSTEALPNRSVMISPDGVRCNLFTDVEAYFGSRLLGLRK
mmetsp:Transcript_52721/g.83670  ORF Transcript_52721/g.83670 Transcript_52721/m.83670 type:complete len:282 (+) Transcript_52721:44-889(+)